MKLIISDQCLRNKHNSCNDPECQCGCHYAERSGVTPERWKTYMEKLKKAEDEIWIGVLNDTKTKVVK
ncbi:MAG: hypothetical protein QXZ17_15155 [Nitrososphaerota archaeon]